MASNKKALIIRHGAFGDCIQATAVLPYVQQDYHEIHWLSSPQCIPLIANNPRLSRVLRYPSNAVELKDLDKYYRFLTGDYDKTFVLSGSVEGTYLHAYPQKEYYWTIHKRRKHCNVNYIEAQIRGCGYEPSGKDRGELYFTPEQLSYAKNKRKEWGKDKFVILWALSGSSQHKVYFHTAEVMEEVFKRIPESLLILVGSQDEAIQLSWVHPKVVNLGLEGRGIMNVFALLKYSDLVVGPETGLMSAAGCFDIPKIVMLTHSSRKNLCSTWNNDFSIQAGCWCSPCHILHKFTHIWKNVCPADKVVLAKYGEIVPSCVGEGFPKKVMVDRILEVYETFRRR